MFPNGGVCLELKRRHHPRLVFLHPPHPWLGPIVLALWLCPVAIPVVTMRGTLLLLPCLPLLPAQSLESAQAGVHAQGTSLRTRGRASPKPVPLSAFGTASNVPNSCELALREEREPMGRALSWPWIRHCSLLQLITIPSLINGS